MQKHSAWELKTTITDERETKGKGAREKGTKRERAKSMKRPGTRSSL